MAKIAKKYPQTVDRGIVQRGEYSFRVKIMRGGNLIDKSFDTVAEARIFRDLTLANAALDPNEQATFEARAKRVETKTFTFADAIKKYRTEKSEQKKGWEKEKSQLDKLARSPAAAMPLYQIKAGAIIELLNWVKTSGNIKRPGSTSSEATQRRYFNLVRHIFQIAVDEWHKIDVNPCLAVPKSARPRDGQPRDRRLQGNEYALMLEQLTGENKIIFILSVETAMRRGEIFSMQWEDLNLKNRTLFLRSGNTKTDEARHIPLSKAAVDALSSLPRGLHGNVVTVTTWHFAHAWKLARVAIGAPDLRMHDMRHEATSRLFEKGFGDIEAASVTGHKTMSMLKRYTHLKHEHILEKLDRPARGT